MIGLRCLAVAPLLFLLSAAATPGAIDLPGDRLHPESVSIAPGGMAYVGSMTGGVLRVALRTGKVERWIAPGAFGSGALFGVFADTRNGLLWTCSNDFSARGVTVPGADPGHVIKGFDLRTGAGKVSLTMPGAKPVCNDFAVARDGSVYVTDTGQPRILRWRKGMPALEIWLEDPALGATTQGGGIDGIALGGDGNLYVNNVRSGELFRIAIQPGGKPGAVTRLTLSRPLVSPDGMRAIGGLDFVVADSKGQVAQFTVRGDRAEIRTLAEGIVQPTGIDAHGASAWYVQGQLAALFSKGQVQPALPFRLTPVALPR